MDGADPSNASMDALFGGSLRAVIRVRAQDVIDPTEGPVLLEVETEELAELRGTLTIIDPVERFHCMCKGDYAIELHGLLHPIGVVSFHHGISLRIDGWNSDAKLAVGPAFFDFLAKRGITEPAEAYERDLVAQVDRELGVERWTSAKPDLDALGRDAASARALFHWLAFGKGAWSGYPSYEDEPLKLLEKFPAEVLIEAASATDLTEEELRGAARYFGSHEVVSFRKSLLGDIPESFWNAARAMWQWLEPEDVEDVMHRFEHAVRLSSDRRAAKTRRVPYRSAEWTVFGESIDGPLSNLVALADGTLVSVDIKQILRFAPGSIAGRLVAEASEHFVVLAASGARIAWGTMNAGEVFSDRERIAVDQKVPVDITAAGERTAWISRDAPGGHEVRTPEGVLAKVSGIHSLHSDATHVYFINGGFNGGTIQRVAWERGIVEKVCTISDFVYTVDAKPAYEISRGELLVPVQKEIRAYDLASGKSRVLIRAPHRVYAIRATETHLAIVMGDEDKAWFVASAPRTGGKVKKLACFSRAPYHRHPLVIARGHAIILSDARIVGVPLFQ